MGAEGLSPVTLSIEREIRAIARGKVSTYGRIARRAGLPNGARQVARVLHSRSAAAKLPWWRVIGQGKSADEGRIALADTGFEEQRALLMSEGVSVSDQGRVDLSVYGWRKEI